MEVNESPEVVEVPSSEPSPEVPAPKTPEATPTIGAPEGAAAAPQYTPSYKFKVHGEEKEFDEYIRPVIKDAETEKKIKELYEKAYGLDHVKPKFETTQRERDELKQTYGKLNQEVSHILEYRDKGDLDTFFRKLNVSDEQVAQYIIDKAKRQSLPPEERRVYDELDSKRRSEIEQSRQIADYDQRFMQMATQARAAELDSVLARTDINGIVQKYDSLNGPGSFKHFVAEIGVMYHTQYGQDPSAQDAVSAALKRLGNAYNSQPATVPSQTAEKQLPVIPNISGKGMSPINKKPKSIDDLRKAAKEMSHPG